MNFEQLKAILWLRWRLTRNQFARGGQLNAAIALLIAGLMVAGGFLSAAAGFFLGISGFTKEQPLVLMLIWDAIIFGFLVFWLTGLLVEIQRSESIDLSRLMHLPVTLRQVFVFNYLVSHATPSIVLILPGMLTLGVGLTLRFGPRMLLLVPLVLSFVFMVTAWTYCLRGWLAALMTNKRRRRTIILWVTVIFVLVCQLPNLLVNSRMLGKPRSRSQEQAPGAPSQKAERRERTPERLIDAHLVIPLGWVGYGAMKLRQGTPWPALAAITAGGVLGILGIMRAYTMTLRFYQGAEGGAKPQRLKPATAPVARERRLLVERELPWVSEETAALALATVRGLLRAPELKMAMIMPVLASLGLLGVNIARPAHAPNEFLGAVAATLLAVMVVMVFTANMSNLFGLDRDGFRALVLLPVQRRRILLAKNLALCPFVVGVGTVLLVLLKLYLRLPGTNLLTGFIQLPTAYLLFALGGNLLSIFAPYRLAQGTLQAKKAKPIVFVAAFASLLLMPFVLVPLAIPPLLQLGLVKLGGIPWLPVNVLTALLILAAAVGAYTALLPIEGRLLQRREQTILKEVTEENE